MACLPGRGKGQCPGINDADYKVGWPGGPGKLLNLEELDFEDQRLIGSNDSARAARAIGEI
jgi:hypothetical protein